MCPPAMGRHWATAWIGVRRLEPNEPFVWVCVHTHPGLASWLGQDEPADPFQMVRFLSPGASLPPPAHCGKWGRQGKPLMGREECLCPQGNDSSSWPSRTPWVATLEGLVCFERHWRIWAAGPGGSEGRLGSLGQKPHAKVPGYPLAQVCTPLTPSPCSLPWQHQAVMAFLK